MGIPIVPELHLYISDSFRHSGGQSLGLSVIQPGSQSAMQTAPSVVSSVAQWPFQILRRLDSSSLTSLASQSVSQSVSPSLSLSACPVFCLNLWLYCF